MRFRGRILLFSLLTLLFTADDDDDNDDAKSAASILVASLMVVHSEEGVRVCFDSPWDSCTVFNCTVDTIDDSSSSSSLMRMLIPSFSRLFSRL
jgi:hypothetical protein